MDYVVMIFCMLSNGKQRYSIKKNSDVAEKVYTYKARKTLVVDAQCFPFVMEHMLPSIFYPIPIPDPTPPGPWRPILLWRMASG